ncbi:hypothetical protein RhiJN_09156 [Ceratobasidium sp. AG-Ba]|nr:hypothetical protein RhiJN_09156 [Ceratobasidium sp. AG-Ba]QRW09921.1 hypothetical protein RhiLY_08920 [Ceratobasidium sp. AG-Ba]
MAFALPSEPSAAMLNLSALVYLLGITIITVCIVRTADNYTIWSKESLSSMPWPRVCLLLTFVDSWLYLFITGMLLHGAEPEHHLARCSVGMLACILLYGASKGLIYLCLIERVHVVWSDGMPRWKSPIYRFCFALLLPLVVIAGVMVLQRTAFVYNGYCILGISRFSSLLLLIYDFCTNIFLTVMFVTPLLRSNIRSAWLRAIALRTTIAACIALVSTAANVIILYVLDGKEMIWVCLGSCGVDVIVNAVVLFWAMQGPPSTANNKPHSIRFPPSRQPTPTQLAHLDTISGVEMGVNPKISEVYPTTLLDYSHPRDEYMSQGMTVSSSVCIPSLEEPEPALHSPHHKATFGQHPWGRSPFPPAEEEMRRSDSLRTYVSTPEEKVSRKPARDSDIYEPGYETVKSAETSRTSSVTPTLPTQ